MADGMTTGPRSYLEPLNLRGRISTPQPKGLPLVNLGFNELPYGPSPKVAAAVAEAAAQVASYGTPLCDGLRATLIFHMNAMAYSLMAMIAVGGCLTVLDRFHWGRASSARRSGWPAHAPPRSRRSRRPARRKPRGSRYGCRRS